ncbi:MAG: hypothetical protein IPP77_09800 [Bacteroidetes bacterium]|nr:hypothetical protein [Bacteroidota bacterium]
MSYPIVIPEAENFANVTIILKTAFTAISDILKINFIPSPTSSSRFFGIKKWTEPSLGNQGMKYNRSKGAITAFADTLVAE